LKLLPLRCGSGAIFRRRPWEGCGGKARRSTGAKRFEGHVDVFENGLGGDASHAIGGLDEVVAALAGMFPAKRVGEDQGLGKLTGTHQEAGAVDGVWALEIHSSGLRCQSQRFGPSLEYSAPGAQSSAKFFALSGATVCALAAGVNSIRIVQWWNSWLRLGGKSLRDASLAGDCLRRTRGGV
jgi:hypothetical protein